MPNISEYLNSVNEPCIFIEHEDGRQESMLKYVYDAQQESNN